MKADGVQCGQIGGVGQGDKQPFAAAVQGQGVVLLHQFGFYYTFRQGLQIEGRDIEARRAEFPRGDLHQATAVDFDLVHQIAHEGHALIGCRRLGFRRLLGIEQALNDQPSGQARGLAAYLLVHRLRSLRTAARTAVL